MRLPLLLCCLVLSSYLCIASSDDYGAPITIDWQQAIKDHFHERLFDPFSAQYEFGELRKSVITDRLLSGGNPIAGYVTQVKVDAKNRFGAYVGWTPYIFVFRDNQIVKVFEMEYGDWWPEGFHRIPPPD
jgi:hypothetical protein